MSWRTQGHYKRLGDAERDWLKEFDRAWDTKAHGRLQTDAFEYLRSPGIRVSEIPATEHPESDLEMQIHSLREVIARFTVPKETKHGWSIHLILKCGKRVRAHFKYKGEAFQAYIVIKDTLAMMLVS